MKLNPFELIKAKKIAEEEVEIVAQDKYMFLVPLRDEWRKHLPKDFDVEEEAQRGWKRIKRTGTMFIFKKANITIEDIKIVLKEIKEEKSS